MDFQKTIRKAASQGAVLLKNNDTLPFTPKDKISIFGRCQIDYYKSGTGSGGLVNVPYTSNLIQGFRRLKSENYPCPELNEELIQIYENWVKENPFDNGKGAWAGEPWCQKEFKLDPKLVEDASKKSNKAIFVIGRTAGEDKDNKTEEGSYFLTKIERENIELICNYFNKVTIVLNVANIIDLSWIEDEKIKNKITGVIFTWHGGMEGGNASAEILCGKENPSGKLTDTIAYSYDDYPCAKYFGNAHDEFYTEDIYVGYRYFSTFNKDKVQFPFGFGLSYTSFSFESIKYNFPDTVKGEKEFSITVKVKNTGKVPGREIIQCYGEAPQGKLGKSKRILLGFKKTNLIEPGKTESVNIKFDIKNFASYDDSGITGYPYSYILEEGNYSVYIGNSSTSCKKIVNENNNEFLLSKTLLIEKLNQNCAPEKSFKILKPGKKLNSGLYEESKIDSPVSKTNLEEKIKSKSPKEISLNQNSNITFQDVLKNPQLINDFISLLSVKELKTLIRGEGMMSPKVTFGVASAFGGVSESLNKKGVPAVGCSDGPSGIRLDNGDKASLVPIGTLLACTWDPELVEELYVFLGKELSEKKIDILLGPGCNIHRSPLNGRNFEYFSEDPLITGIMAGAIVRGLEKNGGIGTLKHFALNNQESHRRTENSIASERALREIYLRPFEIAIKEYGAKSIMTGYNGVNGHWCASNFELISSILKDEWNFSGLVMTDWWAAMNDCVKGGKPEEKNISQMIKAKTNVYMVVPNDTAEKDGLNDDIEESLANQSLSLAELQESAKEILSFISKTNCAKQPIRKLKQEIKLQSSIKLQAGTNLSEINKKHDVINNEFLSYFEITEKSIYSIKGKFSKDDRDGVSQSVTNIMINDKSIGAFECRSTYGIDVEAEVCFVEMDKGIYKLELLHTRPGLELKQISINKI